jgi:hypothetical protein
MTKSHKKARAEAAARLASAEAARATRELADAAAAAAAARADELPAAKKAAAAPPAPAAAKGKKPRHVRPPRRVAAARTPAAASTAAGRAFTGTMAKALGKPGGKRAAASGPGPKPGKRHPIPVSKSRGPTRS